MPIASGTNPRPSASTGRPKVKRWAPVLTSVPTRPSSRPTITIPSDFRIAPLDSTVAATRPRTISEKYSVAPKWLARLASFGPATTTRTVATVPARNELIAAIASAGPARPFSAIWCPSIVVTTLDASPGRFTRIAVVEPPYCAP